MSPSNIKIKIFINLKSCDDRLEKGSKLPLEVGLANASTKAN